MGKIRNIAISLSKKNVVIRNIIRGFNSFVRKINYKIGSIGIKVDEKTILFCCFNGKSYSCSPKAIYEYMINDDKFKDYKFIWAFVDDKKYKYLEENINTTVVKIREKEYKKYLAKAKYWIFNYKIPDFLYPKKNQIFVQCWHGTPLKRLGCYL